MQWSGEKPEFTVKKLSEMAGVSVRTLHLYDEIDLLKPSVRTDAGYRLYGETELLRLQQILFYRELGFKLQQIAAILDDPAFDLIKALEGHRHALQARQRSIDQMLQTLDKTINKIKNTMKMSFEELYEGLPRETALQYRQEAIDAYGETEVHRSENSLRNMSKADFAALQDELRTVAEHLAALINEDPSSAHVQKLIARHYAVIRKFWGTDGIRDKQRDAYAGLGDLYVADGRFTQHTDEAHPAFAMFLAKAMKHFANTVLAE